MTRKMKTLGVPLFALLAFGALSAQAASADIFTSPLEKTVITEDDHGGEEGEHRFSYGSWTVDCATTNIGGTVVGKETTSITLTPTLANCTFTEMQFRMNHCYWVLTTETVEGHWPVYIECANEGERIEIVIPALKNCTLTVAPQTPTEGVTYANEGDALTATFTIETSITRDNPGSSLACALMPNEGYGIYTGASLFTGYEDEGDPIIETAEGTTETHWSWEEGETVDIGITIT